MAKITSHVDIAADFIMDLENTDNRTALRYIKGIIDKKLGEIEEEEKKKNCPIWEELEEVSGCCVDLCSEIGKYDTWRATKDNQNIFINEQHAKSALAMAKISQLMPYYGGIVTDKEWRNSDLKKYGICREADEIAYAIYYNRWHPIVFHTEEQRAAFTNREENVRLVKDYFMID